MPGYDRNLDTTIANQALTKALQDFALVPEKLAQQQAALLAEQQARAFKRPSVFKSGSIYDVIGTYRPTGKDLESVYWKTILSGVLPLVGVLSIEDADVVNLSAYATRADSDAVIAPSTFALYYALTPDKNPTQQIPLSSFGPCPLKAICGFDVGPVSTEPLFASWTDAIPTAGNRYLHFFWVADNVDYNANFLNPFAFFAQGYLGYQLIK